jgi:hypothetical protein
MRFFGLALHSRFCLVLSIAAARLVCSAQQPDESQSCTGAPVTAAAHQVQTVTPAKGSPVAAEADPTAHTIKLLWTLSVSPASTVEGYYIYRREAGPECQKQANHCEPLNLGNPVKGHGCTDYSVVPGRTYIYQAQTVGKNARISTFSNSATATAR